MKNDQIDSLWTTLEGRLYKISVFTLAFIYRQATIFDGNQNKGTVRFFSEKYS